MKYFKLLYFVFTVWIFITYSELFRLTGNGSKEYLNKTTHYVLFRNKIFKMLVGSKYFLWKNRETLRNYWVFCKMLANTVAVQPEKWCQPCPVLFTAGTNNQKFKKLLVSQDLTHVWSYLYSQTWHAFFWHCKPWIPWAGVVCGLSPVGCWRGRCAFHFLSSLCLVSLISAGAH